VTIDECRAVQRGDFVTLRPLRTDDAERTLAWRLSPRAFLLKRGAQTVDEQRAWIAGRPERELNYVIETRAGVPLGMLSLIDIDLTNRRAEPARFLIGDEDAARGIPAAVEAMKLLYVVAFDRLELRRVYGTVVEDNPRMATWQRYLGMKEEGRLREHVFMNGRWQDLLCMGLLEPEYRKVTLPRLRAMIAMAGRPPAP
jgi:RimJ/RimL family protein N-acetyltransferase